MSKRSRDLESKYSYTIVPPHWGGDVEESEESKKRSKTNAGGFDMGLFDDNAVSMIGNRIYFNGLVNRRSVSKLIHFIEMKNKEYSLLSSLDGLTGAKPKPIVLFINSPGGHLIHGFAAVDSIADSVVPIHTVVKGHACSAATLMSIVGKKRYMTPNSMMLIHELSTGVIGKYSNLTDEYENSSMLMKKIKSLYKTYTKIPTRKLTALLSRDLLLDFEKCLEYGIIDEEWAESKPVDLIEMLRKMGIPVEVVPADKESKPSTDKRPSLDDKDSKERNSNDDPVRPDQ